MAIFMMAISFTLYHPVYIFCHARSRRGQLIGYISMMLYRILADKNSILHVGCQKCFQTSNRL